MSILRSVKHLVGKIPGVAGYYRCICDSKTLRRDVEFREKLGFFFNGSPSMQEGEFEPQETRIIESLLDSFDLFVNFGANTGYYVCKALSRNVPVIAFEPNQANVNVLLRNIEANDFQADFQLFPIALGDEHGVIPMYGSSTGASLISGWAGQKSKYLVPISKFDSTAKSLLGDRSCLILIDIEGAELNCLKGATTLLSSRDALFLIEIAVGEHQPRGTNVNPNLFETFELMFSYGWDGYTADVDLRKIEIEEVKEITQSGFDTLGTHNFIFTRDENVLAIIDFTQDDCVI